MSVFFAALIRQGARAIARPAVWSMLQTYRPRGGRPALVR
jgi:hypothetical protein